MKRERLYFTGYMASGKTTLGRAVAGKLGWDFLDLDKEIERLGRGSVEEIMARDNGATFRRLEAQALRNTGLREKIVVACGGGTPCWYDNMEFMNLRGVTVWLLASPEKIAERILEAGDTRPLVRGLQGEELQAYIRSHLLRRQQYYAKARVRFDAEHLETAAEIESAAEKLLSQLS